MVVMRERYAVTDDGEIVEATVPGVRVTVESVGELVRVDSVREGTNLLTRWFAPDEVAAVMAALRALEARDG